MFFYLHLHGEPPVSIDGVYYDQIPAEALHHAERGESRENRDFDANGNRKSGIEDRV
jgi:hypothetical protein